MAKGLTQPQRRTLFATVREAAREQGEQPEAYRKRVMAEELGVEHLSQVSATTGYDTLMARVCRDAGDYGRAAGYTVGSSYRLRRLVVEAAREIAPVHPYHYIAGTMVQSGCARSRDIDAIAAALEDGAGWLDYKTEDIRRVLIMLKSHLRRQS